MTSIVKVSPGTTGRRNLALSMPLKNGVLLSLASNSRKATIVPTSALRQGGRTGEAQALLETSARIVARARREGPLPSWFELNAARIEAVRGNRAAALAALRRARDLGATRQWSDADLGVVRWPDQDPLLAPLASDPQVAAWFRQIAADRARELRETEALLGSAKVAWLLARPLAA